MTGELSNDNQYLTMAFEDVHRLVTTMRMAEVILKERVQNSRKVKIGRIKVPLDAEHGPNMSALPADLEKSKQFLTQKHSFHSVGAFDAKTYDVEGASIRCDTHVFCAVTFTLFIGGCAPDTFSFDGFIRLIFGLSPFGHSPFSPLPFISPVPLPLGSWSRSLSNP